MDFGERIKVLREELNLSREDLANTFEISYSTLSKYETNGRFPDKETLKRFADFFNVSVDYLLCRTNDRSLDDNNTTIDLDNFAFDNKQKLKKDKNILFNGEPASQEDIDCILEAIEMGVALARQRKKAREKK